MEFKTKDLLVTVLPKAEISEKDLARICYLGTRVCLYPTYHCGICSVIISYCIWPSICPIFTCGGCSIRFTLAERCPGNSCGPGRSACDPTMFCAATEPFVLQNPQDLVTLRDELKRTLTQLDELEKTGLTGGLTSKAEAENVERSLTEALEQVKAAKKKLK